MHTRRFFDRRRARTLTLAVVMWLFGLSVSTLLVGMWGRSVVSDRSTLEEAAGAVLETDVVSDRVVTWLTDGLASVIGDVEPEVEAAVLAVAGRPEANAALEAIVDGFVEAAVAPPGTETSVDVAGALSLLAPAVFDEMAARGIDPATIDIDGALSHVGSVILETEEAVGVDHAAAHARGVLTWVMVVGGLAVLSTGALAVALSPARVRMVRTLATRLAVSAFTFVVFLRVSRWAVDPAGGRSPVARGGAVLLGSHHGWMLTTGVGALVIVAAASLWLRRRRAMTVPVVAEVPERILVEV